MKKILSIFLCLLLFTIQAAAAPTPPDISAEGAILIHRDTGEVLYEKNADAHLFPASTTKIMTALLAIEHGGLDSKVTLSEKTFEGLSESGSTAGLKPGETVTVRQLLYCLMIPSSNEAANALAEHVAGSVPEFVRMMNTRAAELGCENTHFTNTTGLHDEDHYTSARDLSIITTEAMKSPVFAEIVKTSEFKLPPTNKVDKERTFYTTNYLLSRKTVPDYYNSAAIGIKTGHTTPAGPCLVSAASKNDINIITVILKASGPASRNACFTETLKLFSYTYDTYKVTIVAEKNDPIHNIRVKLGNDIDSIPLVAEEKLSCLLPNTIKIEDLEILYEIPESIKAPIEKGQVIGTATYQLDGKIYGKITLISPVPVSRNFLLYILDCIAVFFTTPLVIYILIALAALLIGYIIFRTTTRKNRRYRGQRRRRY